MINFTSPLDDYRSLKQEIDSAISETMSSGDYVNGRKLKEFESRFAKYIGAKECVGVGNGLDALTLSLMAVGVHEGDEVIVPAHTFIATWLAVSRCGATPVGVDVNIDDFNINVDMIAEKISKRTKAIVPVHLYGTPFNLDKLYTLANKHGLIVVEDAAQAHGAKYFDSKIGSKSDIVCWSFYPTKNLGAIGDGGAITLNNTSLADKIRKLRNYGSALKYHHDEMGLNSRLDDIQASVLSIKLKSLDAWNYKRHLVADFYLKKIKNNRIELPRKYSEHYQVWHLFVIKSDARALLANHLEKNGVPTLIHYPIPPHKQKIYNFSNDFYPISERLANTVLSIPMHPHLTGEEIQHVVKTLNDFKD
jgi:dTDP-4-amino-4,6-dideoxygalactose transaminase